MPPTPYFIPNCANIIRTIYYARNYLFHLDRLWKVLKPFPTITHPSIPENFSKTPTIFFFLVYILVFLVTPLHHTFISCHPSQLVKNGLRFEVGRDNIEIENFWNGDGIKEKVGDIQEQQQLSLTQHKKPGGLRGAFFFEKQKKIKKLLKLILKIFIEESKIIDFSNNFHFLGRAAEELREMAEYSMQSHAIKILNDSQINSLHEYVYSSSTQTTNKARGAPL